MEIWTNGQQPKQETPPKFEQPKSQPKQIGCGTYILWWIIIFCVIGAIFGGKM